MKNFFAFLLVIVFGFTMISWSAPQTVLAADSFGLEDTANQTPFKGSTKSLPQVVGAVISAGLALVGVVFLVLAVYAGFRWMTARGETKATTEARDTLVDATIGIILIVAAYAITNFLFGNVLLKLN